MDISLGLRGHAGAGSNTDPIGSRGPNPYHPTVTFLLLMVLAEVGIVFLLRFGFRHSHGG